MKPPGAHLGYRGSPAATRGFVAPIAVMLACSCGCGYRVVRAHAPFGAARIAVEPFAENQPVGLSAQLTHELSRLLASGGVRLTTDRQHADAVLTGRVLSELTSPSPTASSARVRAYRVNTRISAELVDPDGNTLWSTAVSVREDFLPPSDPLAQPAAIETNRRLALHRLAERAAVEIHQRLVLEGSIEPDAPPMK